MSKCFEDFVSQALRVLTRNCAAELRLYKDIDGNFRKLDTGDNILYEKWKLMEDSVIFIGGHKFMIRRITNKEMLLERNNKVGRLKFIK